MKAVLGFLLCLSLTLTAYAGEIDSDYKDIVGAWECSFTGPDEVHRQAIIIVGRQLDELVAWYVDDKSEVQKFKEVKLDGDSLQLTIETESYEGDVTVTLEASLTEADKCNVEATYQLKSGDRGYWEFDGRRMRLEDFDQSSHWDLVFTSPEGQSHKALVTVVQKDGKAYGWYSSDDYELPSKSLTVSGDQVTMVMEGKLPSGSDVEVTFDGKIAGDGVTGEAVYRTDGDAGRFPFTAESAE